MRSFAPRHARSVDNRYAARQFEFRHLIGFRIAFEYTLAFLDAQCTLGCFDRSEFSKFTQHVFLLP